MSVALSLYANGSTCGWDNDEEPAGRIRTAEEFVAAFRARTDIFTFHRDRHAQVTEIASVAVAIGVGAWLSSVKQPVEVRPDPMEKGYTHTTAQGTTTVIPAIPRRPEPVPAVHKPHQTERRTMQPSEHPGRPGHKRGGGGDIRARVTQHGIFALMTARVAGRGEGVDPLSPGGFSEEIDGVFAGMGAMKPGGGDGGTGRRGFAGIGIGPGYEPGFGGGEGGNGLDGMLDGGEGATAVVLRPRTREIGPNVFTSTVGIPVIGGRSKSSIQRVVMQYMQALRYAYSKRLRENPNLKGTITVKFGIDESGEVLGCTVVSSTMGDELLAQSITKIVMQWRFGKIDKPSDVTEVVYPFVFTM